MIDQPATATDFAKWRSQAAAMDEAALHFAIRDCHEAAGAMSDWNPDRAGFYTDQALTFADELYRRRQVRFQSIRAKS
jgi:hypothetical protein